MRASTKDILREILKSKSRFLSILLIVLLGTLVFVGLSTTTYNINKNVNMVLEKNDIYDLRLESYIELSDSDFDLINGLDGIKKIVKLNETIDDNNNLIIQNKNLEKSKKVELKNSNKDSKYYSISYISKNIIKNGVEVNKVYYENSNDSKKPNVVLIYFDRPYKFDLFSKKYLRYIKEKKHELRSLFRNRPEARKKEIVNEINEGILEIDNAFIEISKNELLLNEKLDEVNENKLKLEEAKKVFKENKRKLKKANRELENKEKELELNKEKINKGLKKINEKLPELLVSSGKLREGYKKLENKKDSIFLSVSKYEKYKEELDKNKKIVDDTFKTRKELIENREKIENGFNEIKKAKEEIEKNKLLLEKEENKYELEYKKNLNKLNEGREQIKASHKILADKRQELEEKRKELISLKSKVIKPLYAVSSIYDNLDYQALYNNYNSMFLISFVFTSLFFLISLFIVSTTIIRFSIEQRNIIGTYKFLGYGNLKIISKFMIYALIPAILGIVIGTVGGTYFVPSIIYPSFFTSTIDIFSKYTVRGELLSIFLNLSLLIIVIVLTIIFILKKILSEKVITLLSGNEDDKVNFKIKNIVIRNLLKYKLRLFMTLLGIGLCTSLIYLGVGLRYSIKDIAKKQYTDVEKFDAKVFFKPNATQDEINKYINNLENVDILRVKIDSIKVENKLREVEVQKVEIIDDNYESFLNFKLDENKSAISESLYDILKLKETNKLVYYDMYNILYDISISKSFKNYISQYIYTKNKKAKTNAIYIRFNDKNKSINLESDIVYSINNLNNVRKYFNDQVSSLDIIVIFMVVLGGVLAILVTYNLANINIIERRRELSTLEVLGYKERELDLYIFREIIILAIISIILGIGLGNLLIRLVAYQFRESLILVLNFNIYLLLYSFIIPLIFVFIVLFILKFKIRNINMIESLKMSE
ncbi:FtsX-like permease family protein [Oceanivirga miroungae]|uniref:ABC3 transporter permease C-terminal domain-containing protein n=1 Tax=Oceanivirga miroungae TaxID=1130046 RepID=A0A6I8M9Z1_9FUSO|nr:FtsX-like permease family protein [Oceanivirga miroungae]VWL85639.1 hypothetical protein OMES3154_00924 [Oceanivirga miroungae]